jgi:hypothetical protein
MIDNLVLKSVTKIVSIFCVCKSVMAAKVRNTTKLNKTFPQFKKKDSATPILP